MSEPRRECVVEVGGYKMTRAEYEALFDRVADAAHGLGAEVSCSGSWNDAGRNERFKQLARSADRMWRQLLFAYLIAFTLLIALILEAPRG